MAKPNFSVIIPTYNRGEFITRTLSMVFAQTLPPCEIIVVDNCSTDGTEELLRPYAEAGRIHYIRHSRNFERAVSRNTGLRAASGDFITFLDSDDLMYRQNLKAAAAFAQAHPEVNLFHNLYEHVDEHGRVIHRWRFPSLRDHRAAIADGNFLSCIGTFVRRPLYETLAFDTDERLVGSEDWLFWIRAFAGQHTVGRIPYYYSAIGHHTGRSVNEIDLGRMRSRLELMIQTIESDEQLARAYERYLPRLRAGSELLLASAANSVGAGGTALRQLIAAGRCRPRSVVSEKAARIFARAVIGRRPAGPSDATSGAAEGGPVSS